MADQNIVKIYFDLSLTNSPQWRADPKVDKIPWGSAAHIVWQLVPGKRAPGAVFPSQGGVVFTPSAARPDPWPNAQPVPVPTPADQPLVQYQAEDPNYSAHAEAIDYKYTVTVVWKGYVYSWDPEIENEGGP